VATRSSRAAPVQRRRPLGRPSRRPRARSIWTIRFSRTSPGTVFAYSQPCTYALASIIQRQAGMPLTGYLRPRLFDPLGIGHVGWNTFPPGREQGFLGADQQPGRG
jgi:CubicO group peptidase (beta-lactamase class C family)